MTNTITFKWNTGNIEIAACAVLDMTATQLKNLVKTATANAEEVKNQIAEYIQSEIDKLNPKSEYDKKMIAQYNKLISAACGERRQTAQEKAISRIMKNCSAAMADKYMGVIHDADMYCVLDGFRLVRYTAPIENMPTAAQTFDTNRAIGDKSRYTVKLALPTVKDLKADMKISKLSGMDVNRIHVIRKGKRLDFGYDFGYGMPMVNAKWLIDMIEALPDAAAYAAKDYSCNPIYFTDGENDGILLPIRKMQEYESAPAVEEKAVETAVEKPIEKPVEAAAPVVKEDPAPEVKDNKPSAANVPTVKNLSQFKKAISAGYAFKIVKHYIKPELSGQIRKPNKVQTNAFYSVVQGEPNNPVSLANDGKGYYLNYGKAGDWDFSGDTIKMYAGGNPVWEITFDLSYPVDVVPVAVTVDPAIEERKRREEQDRIERYRALADELEKAEQAIIDGGYIENKNINGKCVFLRLFDKYDIDIAIRTRGWIINKLTSVIQKENGGASLTFRRKTKTEKVSHSFVVAYFKLRDMLIKAKQKAEAAPVDTVDTVDTAEAEQAAAEKRVEAVAEAVKVNDMDDNKSGVVLRLFKRGFITEDEAKQTLLFPVSVRISTALALPAHEEAAQDTAASETIQIAVVIHPAVLRPSARHYRQFSAKHSEAITVYHAEPDSTTHVSIMNNAFCLNSS